MAEEIIIRTELLGFNELIKTMRRDIDTRIQQDVGSMYDSLSDLLDIIKADYVPIDTGQLRDSGFISNPFQTPNGWEVAIGFAEPYALIQHERLDYNHPHGQAKYLEEPLAQWFESHK